MSKVLKGAGILAICSLIAKMIGALYRIPLTNVVGAEGIGLYQMVFPLYTVLLTISSGGLPVAISKVVSGKIAGGDEAGARQVFFVSLISLTIIGSIGSLVIVLLRNQIALIQGNPKAALPYLGIAPSIVIVAVISCFRGYYQGKQNMLPSAISQIIEQVIKLFVGLSLAGILMKHSLEAAVLGALLGVSVSEFLAMAVLAVQFLITDYRYKKRSRVSSLNLNFEAAADLSVTRTYKPKSRGSILKEIYKVAIPVTLGSLVMPMTQVIDSILVINLLVNSGLSRAVSTSMFGLMTGPVNSLINMPVVITLSLSVALLPKVSECFSKKESCSESVGQSFKYSFIIGLMSALLFGVFAKPIFSVLYSRGLTAEQIKVGGALLAVGSISIFYVSILQVATAVLQGVNMPHKPALNLLYGAAFKVILTLAMLPVFGIMGAMASTVICYGITCFLDIKSMKKIVKLKVNFKEFIAAPLLSGGLLALSGISSRYLLARFLPASVALVTAMIIGALFFALGLILFGAVKKEEIAGIPIIGKIIKKLSQMKEKRRNKKG